MYRTAIRVTSLNRRFIADGGVAVPEAASVPVDGFAVSGMLRLKNDHRSLVRIILVFGDGADTWCMKRRP